MAGGEVLRHTDVEPLIVAVGVGRTVTVVNDEPDGPLHPLAVTLTVAIPEKPEAHVTVPVGPVPEIVLPAPVTVQL